MNALVDKDRRASLVALLMRVAADGAVQMRVRLRKLQRKMVAAVVARIAVDDLKPVHAVIEDLVAVAVRMRVDDQHLIPEAQTS